MNRFVKYEFVAGLWPPNSSYEQTNIFLYACAAATIAAIIFSKGAPYRKPLYTNGMGPTKNYIVLLLEGNYVEKKIVFFGGTFHKVEDP